MNLGQWLQKDISAPRKGADPLPTPTIPSWGSRHSGFMQTGRRSSRNSCVSAALVEEVLELLLEIHPNRTWGTPGRLHSPCSGGKNHIQIGCSSFLRMKSHKCLSPNTMWPMKTQKQEGRQTGPHCKEETDFRLKEKQISIKQQLKNKKRENNRWAWSQMKSQTR